MRAVRGPTSTTPTAARNRGCVWDPDALHDDPAVLPCFLLPRNRADGITEDSSPLAHRQPRSELEPK